MNYLITGGTGLIGKALTKELAKHASAITVLTRSPKAALNLGLGSNVTFINSLSIENIENQDTVINLAGEPIADKRWSKIQKDKICSSRWNLTEQLVEFIQAANKPPSLFISGSAVGIYGRQNSTEIDETFNNFHEEFTHHVCAKWEAIANQAKSNKTRVALLRTGIVLDKNKGALAKMLLPFKLCLGGKIGNGRQMMSWIHIEDMVAAIVHIQQNNALSGPINITAPNPVSNSSFSADLAKAINRPCLLTTPAPLLNLLLGEMAGLIVYGQNVVPNKLVQNGYNFNYPTLELALDNLLNTK
ncbi:TIGR01777 family oxidoreductase [Thalassotalea piscium]|uniref:TIGR01777 family protein n=1 Tax=Thalassotalea piscium TaxID=1230533 RepID=A0A7X0NH11_9GAMM|nr:TIGR01777 family oxidoreductase [Thalassotalea piscium]MBB6543259.1 hypothetical protein [Thalassotalea piscium]